jgi:prepilin-type N-terminal cleavage/methylation domain-containing protein
MRRRGFSLMELVFAIAIGALLVAVAASLARWGSQQTGRGDEQNQLSQRTRLLRAQLRADIEAAGIGSTGAIAVPPTALYLRFAFPSDNGRTAMPVVLGENNVVAAGVMPNTDIIQVVVADPTTRVTTDQPSGPPEPNRLFIDQPIRCPNDLVYIVDHSAANGAGRTHLARIDGASPTSTLRGAEVLQFSIAPGSDVMCGRISVYWLDPAGQLMRADLDPDPGAGFTTLSGLLGFTSAPEVISPGGVDLQIAYSLSSEADGVGRTAAPAARWAYGTGSPTTIADENWFEVRMVRINLLLRSLRMVQESTFAVQQGTLEDEPPPGKTILQTYGRQLLTTTVVLTNQKYFDYSATAGQSAEPF